MLPLHSTFRVGCCYQQAGLVVGLSPICSPAFFSVPCSSLNFQRSTGSGILNIAESENHQFQLFQNTYRRCGFHERTNKEPVVFWLVI
jgi:hypothetical protein